MSADKPGSGRGRDIAILAIIVTVAFGGIAAYGFYNDEITSYVRLRGWDLSPVTAETHKFLEAMAANDGERVAAMISPKANDLKPVRAGGKVVALTVYRYGSTTPETLTGLVPSARVEVSKPRLNILNGGSVSVRMQFPQAHDLELRWDRTGEGWKVVSVNRIKEGQ